MDDQLQPVEDTEFVYRRIPRRFYQADLPVPVDAVAFRPNSNDTTWLSVFRSRFVEPAPVLASLDASKQLEYLVAQLAIADLRRLGLTDVPEPDPNGPPGHAVIPELSWSAYQADKQRLKRVQLELARLASAHLVHQPG